MNEDFLHYVWKFQKFSSQGLATFQGESLQVLKVGTHNFNAGPDFLYGQVVINGQVWAGTIEIHLHSSHWYTHHHEKDANYDTVILHVVWEHDMDIRRSDETSIPTLELKDKVDAGMLRNYKKLFSNKLQWINCEDQLTSVGQFVLKNWLDRLFFERLEQKSRLIFERLVVSQNDWEALLFQLLCKNFGLKVNGSSFLSIALSMDHKVVKKCSQSLLCIEALLLGQATILEEDKTDTYYEQLQENYLYSRVKYKISSEGVEVPKFFRLRPPNFPTIRLSQLANLLYKRPHLFSEVISARTPSELYTIFNLSASSYWDSHYNFGVISAKRKKSLTKEFINLLIINTVIPLKYCYAKEKGLDISEEILELATTIKAEDNNIVKKFKSLSRFENNALESQGLLELKNNYCDKNKCLQCAVGNALLKK
jgi:uncharacterized protein DUF2851